MQDWSAQNFVQKVSRDFQPCTSAHTNPTPGLTLTLKLARTPTLWGARGRQGQSRGSAACFGGVSPTKIRAADRPVLINKTRLLHKVSSRPVLHIGRANNSGVSWIFLRVLFKGDWGRPVFSRPSPIDTCVALPTKHIKSPDNKDIGSTPGAVFFTRTFLLSPLAPTVSIEPKFGRADMSSFVHSRECAKATALFVSSFGADLVAKGGSRRLIFQFLVLL